MLHDNQYVVLAEANGEEQETWMYFIKLNGNEKALHHLKNIFSKVDMYILEDLSTFELDLEHPVSEQTAKEMSKIEVNSYMYHRKFDGELEIIDFDFEKDDDNDDMLEKLFDVIGMGGVENYIDGEDVSDSESSSDDSEHMMKTSPPKIRI